MKRYTKTGKVIKYIHENGTETIIKDLNRNGKFSVFLSVSRGCSRGCDFCGITVDKIPYSKVSAESIKRNTLEAVRQELTEQPYLADKYFKLCFMGMGEIASLPADAVFDIGSHLVDAIGPKVAGIDGVDISSSCMFSNKQVIAMQQLQQKIQFDNLWLRTNPAHEYVFDRSVVRAFYSLHANPVPHTRDFEFFNGSMLDLHFNLVLLDGIDIDGIIYFLKPMVKSQVRLLRYNRPAGSPRSEVADFEKECARIVEAIGSKRVKVQLSPGGEIKASCGMFGI